MVGPLFICLEIGIEVIREKKQLQNCKHDKELDQDNLP
jgi:hypothetical protein